MNITLKKEQLVQELALSLDDTDALSFYRQCANDYPEELLRKLLTKVLSIPQDKIKKSRGALFTHLLHGHANKNTFTRSIGYQYRHP